MIGLTYNRLTIIREAGVRRRQKLVLCKCVCGTEKTIEVRFILNGDTKSCGCLHRDIAGASQRKRKTSPFCTNPLDHIDEDIFR